MVDAARPDRTANLSNEFVRFDVRDRTGVITFTRPDSRNALHDGMHAPITTAVNRWVDDPAIGCVVLTGEGAAFCAGGDVRVGSGRQPDGSKLSPDERVEFLTECAQLSVLLRDAPIITLAAVNGAAVGAGMALALACDLRIGAESARFIGGWAKLGFSGDYGGAWLLRHRVGAANAIDILASNRTVAADEALRIGLLDRLVPDDIFESAWREWAATFAAGPQTAIGLMKANLRDAEHMDLGEVLPVESRRQIETGENADHREGVRAWVEKRAPRFGQHWGSGKH